MAQVIWLKDKILSTYVGALTFFCCYFLVRLLLETIKHGHRFLLDYQKGKGLPQAIKAHIQAGIDHAEQDPDSLLVFSGGETRAKTGPMTEGSSYFHVADAMDMWKGTVRARTVTEEFATDSFENL